MPKPTIIPSGVPAFDRHIGGLAVGDNVIWYDDAGSLADAFYLGLLRESLARALPVIYVSFDRSVKNLLEKLGPLAASPHLTVLDCFTFGKGDGAEIFTRFPPSGVRPAGCRIQRLPGPRDMEAVSEAFYRLQAELGESVRFVFESLTGMQALWGGEERLVHFYTRTCPRLYDLNTIAYWVIEKKAHSQRLRAQINQIAQVVIELSVRRGRTALRLLKAEGRRPSGLSKTLPYTTRDAEIVFDEEPRGADRVHLGARIRGLRSAAGLSQSEVARHLGVTPSTVSQMEGGLIYPSIPALFRLAEVLGVEVGSVLQEGAEAPEPIVFEPQEADPPEAFRGQAAGLVCRRLLPAGQAGRLQPFLVDIPVRRKLAGHFFQHKGEEVGFLLEGQVELTCQGTMRTVVAGQLIRLRHAAPSAWRNPGASAARLLWLLVD
jgi:transcriptional regulator with XRE-family HTH domain/KaiC/GvpD/RAD55 family RecA-like ATPase